MAGIYIHIPYCKTRCIYCDFFTQTNTRTKPLFVGALCREISLRKDYLLGEPIETIYFGGGTPSQLSGDEFEEIFKAIYSNFEIVEGAEITLEANPDDLTDDYIKMLRSLPFNRISIGVQSFDDAELKFLNRRHSAQRAKDVVLKCREAGLTNISIDLMYGLPNQTMDVWQRNLQEAINLNVSHISSYHLIYEEGTKLYAFLQQGKVRTVEEELSVDMFGVMIDKLYDAGFEHYEISNFARKGLYSKHNSSYWLGVKYLGLGPSAHSFDGQNRAFNVLSISKYISGMEKGKPLIELEILDEKTRYNDFIITGLRTMWGIDLNRLKELFGDKYLNYCLENIQKYIDSNQVKVEGDKIVLSRAGIFISDGIMSDLMYV